MTNNYDNTMLEIIVSTGNHMVAPFVKTILIENPNTNPQAIIAFFKFWDNFSRVAGVWVDDITYSFDGCIEAPEEGSLMTTDIISDLYEDFINITIFDLYNSMNK